MNANKPSLLTNVHMECARGPPCGRRVAKNPSPTPTSSRSVMPICGHGLSWCLGSEFFEAGLTPLVELRGLEPLTPCMPCWPIVR